VKLISIAKAVGLPKEKEDGKIVERETNKKRQRIARGADLEKLKKLKSLKFIKDASLTYLILDFSFK
jgi:hypothetical protein